MAEASTGPPPESLSPGGAPAKPAARSSPVPIEQLARNIAVVAGSFYVLGFLTTNSYLYTLGVSDFSLLRTRFV